MMKDLPVFFIIALSITACSGNKEKTTVNTQEESVHPPYDTVALDSFSAGAISVDVAEQIRRSSIAYRDSVNRQIQLQKEAEEARLLEEEKARQEKEAARKKAETKPEQEPVTKQRSEDSE